MSVWRTSYLVYGYKFEEEKDMNVFNEHYDELDEPPYSEMFNDEKSEQEIIYDGMCGNYAYIGIVLAKIDEDEYDGYAEIDQKDVNGLDKKLKKYEEKWPDYVKDIVKDKDPKLYFFIHAY